MRKSGPCPGDRWEKADLGCPEVNLCSLKGREWCGVGVRSGSAVSERISPRATPPLLTLLHSFNKHLTFAGRKTNTPEVTSLCSRELLLAAKNMSDS